MVRSNAEHFGAIVLSRDVLNPAVWVGRAFDLVSACSAIFCVGPFVGVKCYVIHVPPMLH